MHEIRTERMLLRPFRESDYGDLFEFLFQLEDNEFESYPGITWENGREHLKYRLRSNKHDHIVWERDFFIHSAILCIRQFISIWRSVTQNVLVEGWS